jgi:hypothetical protein
MDEGLSRLARRSGAERSHGAPTLHERGPAGRLRVQIRATTHLASIDVEGELTVASDEP